MLVIKPWRKLHNMTKSMLNKWSYSSVGQVCYSDPKQESYKKAAEFLGDTVEDWACGTGWAKKYFKNYKGIDGSPSEFIKPDEVINLVNYESDIDNILMREALEYNTEWRKILENVKKSFKKKFCLIISTPFAENTYIYRYYQSIPEIRFKKQNILDIFPKDEFKLKEETIKTNHLYNQDWILYVER